MPNPALQPTASPRLSLTLGRKNKALSEADHLELLYLDGKNVQVTLKHITDNLRASANSQKYIRRRFRYSDWRGHLISVIAILLNDDRTGPSIQDVWQVFDEGSWVGPQLAVAMPFLDEAFVQHARSANE